LKSADIRLVAVTVANQALVAALELAADQMDFVASNAESLEEAETDDDARPRVVMTGDRVVGFLMYEAPRDDDEARIYRFMIDRASQRLRQRRAA
jgi:diamine N-acetyltransferase